MSAPSRFQYGTSFRCRDSTTNGWSYADEERRFGSLGGKRDHGPSVVRRTGHPDVVGDGLRPHEGSAHGDGVTEGRPGRAGNPGRKPKRTAVRSGVVALAGQRLVDPRGPCTRRCSAVGEAAPRPRHGVGGRMGHPFAGRVDMPRESRCGLPSRRFGSQRESTSPYGE
jgi:hypothetical protein